MKKILLLYLIFFSHYIQALDKNAVFPPEGKYNKDISIQIPNVKSPVYFYFDRSHDKKPLLFSSKDNPVILSAAEGEEKKYKIIFTDKNTNNYPLELTYIIDKKRPPPPEIDLKGNMFSFINSGISVFYRPDRGDWKIWNNEKISINSLNTVFYYSQDSAGNKSIVKTWSNQHYKNISTENNSFKLLSPVKGDFYNKQHLYIDASGFEWIRYSFKNQESALKGTAYKKPLIINRTGSVDLYIAAKAYGSNEIQFKSVSFNVNVDASSIKSSLLENNNFKYLASVSDKIIIYSLNNENYTRYEAPVKLVNEKDSINYNVIKLKTYDDKSSYSFRYFFCFDNRREDRLKETGEKKIINNIPQKPVLEGIKTFSDGSIHVCLKQEKDISFVYTISEHEEPENPSIYSSISESLPVIRNPYGRDSSYFFKISSIDNYGTLSEPLTLRSISVDHYPPEKPEITVKNNNLEFKGNDDIYYRIISDSSIVSEYKKYSMPVLLRSLAGISENISIEYYSSDKSGNKSVISKFRYKSDNSYPSFSDENIKSIYCLNTDYILKKNIFNPDYEIFYTLSDSVKPPEDPDRTSLKMDNDLVFKCPAGEEKYYTVKIFPVSKINNNAGDIKQLYFHIDKIAPPAPVLMDLKDIYYSDNAVITLKGAVSGNTVYYSYSLDENNLDSPFNFKKAFDNTIIIPNPDKSRKTFYLKTASFDKAGNKTVSDRVFSIIIDNRDYPVRVLSNISDSTITDSPFSVKKPDDDFIYRYSISNKKELLSHPDYKSKIMENDIVFNALPGEEKYFYLSVKAYFDIYDNKGSDERVLFIKTDRKKPEKPVITISENNTIQISGENRVFYAAFPEKTVSITPEYHEYIKPFKLNRYLPPGRYNIKAYSVDNAGNISNASDDSFYISRKSIYISSEKGDDLNSGTLSSPLKTLKKAFDLYRKEKIDTLFLLPGIYNLSEPLVIDNPLFIKGIKDKTIIIPDTTICKSIFSVKKSVLILKDLNIRSDNYCSNYFSSENSLTVIDNTEINADSSKFAEIVNSRMIIENSSFSLESVFLSEPFSAEEGSITVSDSSFNISSSSGIKSFSLKMSSLKTNNCSFFLNSDKSLFIESVKSLIKNDNTRLKIESSSNAAFYKIKNSSLFIGNSFYSDSYNSDEALFIESYDSELKLTDSSIKLSSNKSSFINAEKGDYNINRIMLIINSEKNTIPYILSSNAVFHIEDSDITIKNFINGGLITAADSIFEIYKSEINNLSDRKVFLIDLKGRGTSVLRENIFVPDEFVIKHSKGISVIKD